MVFKFEDYDPSFGGEIKCPSCGSHYLHHSKVEVFERQEEDSQTGLHVTVEACKLTTDMDVTNTPSKRRDGVLIHFWCEGCDAKPVMSLAQHKGNTWINFK